MWARRALRLAAALALPAGALLVAAGCGGGEGALGRPRLVVSAAASMSEALMECSRRFRDAEVRLSFAGSDELAAQIRQGVKPDVYVAANTDLPERLREEGLLERPVRFATNELVVALRAGSAIDSLRDLAEDGATVAIGSESVPVGSYAREVLGRLPEAVGAAILSGVRSNEPDVRGIVGKVSQGAVDAGFVYRSDVNAARGRLESLSFPPRLRPAVVYAAGVVRGAMQRRQARRYVHGLVTGPCRHALSAAGFGSAR